MIMRNVVPCPGLEFEHHPAAQLLGHEIINDVQAKSGAAFVAARGEEGVERLALHVGRHAGAVVGKCDLDIVAAARLGRDRNGPRAPVGKGMGRGVQEQVGQNLAVRAGIAVDDEVFRHFDRQRDRRLLQRGPQARDDLVGRLIQIEGPPLGMRAVDRDLLEGLNEFAGAVQIAHQLLGGVARGPDEFVELRAS